MHRTFFGVVLMLVSVGMLTAALNVRQVKAQENGTITINADGSITSSTAPISTIDNITYTFTGDIMNYSIIVSRSSIVLDGADHTLRGSGSGNGISLASINNVTIRNINVTDFDYGVYLHSSSNDTVSWNYVATNNVNGIDLYRSSNNTVSWNDATANGCGIYLESSSNNTVSWNDATANGCGIYLESSSSNIVSGNNATTNSFYGIELLSSSNNTLCENTLTANNSTGVGLKGSSGNTFYQNNFIDNAKQVSSDRSPNTWDNGYPSGGNYWSDYRAKHHNATENDSSGIWNASYVINSNDTDYYPLIQPWSVSVPPVPELPSLMTLPLFMITTLLAALAFKKKQNAKIQ